MKINKNLLHKAKNVQLLILDVDGILTDGKIYYTSDGKEIKAFNVLDGHGIVMLRNAGIKTAIISGRKSNTVKIRAKELGISYVYQGVFDKVKVMKEIIKKEKIQIQNVCYMGDDVTDLELLSKAGFSVTVENGVPEVKSIVDYITTKKGGEGAVREIAEIILKARGLWEDIIKNYKSRYV